MDLQKVCKRFNRIQSQFFASPKHRTFTAPLPRHKSSSSKSNSEHPSKVGLAGYSIADELSYMNENLKENESGYPADQKNQNFLETFAPKQASPKWI